MSIRPPDDVFELGTPVVYHHRACEARVPAAKQENWVRGVLPKEGPSRYWITTGPAKWEYESGAESPVEKMPFNGKRNKTVVCWPCEGSGIVIGLVRKGIGQSHAGYESGYEYPEYEPGYFVAEEWVWLYAIKGWLNGVNYVLAPMWATTKEKE